jgi:lipid II:glycine glycyltransferase (peptidoglycan interpeptide bridge formation enzyme)
MAGIPQKRFERSQMNKRNGGNFVLLNIEDEGWASFVHSHPSANVFHHPAWAKLISECYGYRSFVCAITDEDRQIQAGVPVVELNSWLTGNRWVSLPYTDFCQPLSNSSFTLDRLVDGLLSIYQHQKIPTIELRWALPQKSGISCGSEFVIHTLSLSTDVNYLFNRLRRDHRYNLRKTDPDQVQVVEADKKCEFEAFYRLHIHTRRRLGVPVQPKKFFDLVWENLIRAGLGFVLLAYHNKEPIAGAIFLNFKDTVIYKYSASNETYWKLFPNQLLLWQAIQLSCGKGYKVFNFGNSPSKNKGLREFKLGWGSTETDLIYSYIGSIPIKSQDGVGKKIMSTVIRHSPAVVCRLVGELLYKHFG